QAVLAQTAMLEAAMVLGDRSLVSECIAVLDGAAAMSMDGAGGLCPARLLGDAATLLGDREPALRYYQQALETGGRIGFRPEIALTRLGLAELLGAAAGPLSPKSGGTNAEADADERDLAEAREHLDFADAEFEAMGMQPALARARQLEGVLAAADTPLLLDAPTAPLDESTVSAPAPRVFISYSSDDRPTALALAEKLEAQGIAVWLDRRNIGGGASWDDEIVRGIKSSAVFAVLCSPAAMASDNVRQELRLAMQYRKPLLPLLLAPTEFPEGVEYVLAGRQWVEVLDHPEDVWLPRVVSALKRLR
ncbi:MAG: toll/interleukin-1 receptor domain-containing protein, partial [Dehalococcoidia bacterium]